MLYPDRIPVKAPGPCPIIWLLNTNIWDFNHDTELKIDIFRNAPNFKK
jgi:hypothetical protein